MPQRVLLESCGIHKRIHPSTRLSHLRKSTSCSKSKQRRRRSVRRIRILRYAMLRSPSLVRFLTCDGYRSLPSVIRSAGLSGIVLVEIERDFAASAVIEGKNSCITVSRNTYYASTWCLIVLCHRLRPLRRTNNISDSEERPSVQHCYAHTNFRRVESAFQMF